MSDHNTNFNVCFIMIDNELAALFSKEDSCDNQENQESSTSNSSTSSSPSSLSFDSIHEREGLLNPNLADRVNLDRSIWTDLNSYLNHLYRTTYISHLFTFLAMIWLLVGLVFVGNQMGWFLAIYIYIGLVLCTYFAVGVYILFFFTSD